MNKKWLLAGVAIPAVAAVIALRTPSRAADHLDSPGAVNDPAGDITDVYAFMSPDTNLGTAKHLVMVMNLTPNAGASSKFSDKIEYWFRTHKVASATPGSVGANGSATLDPAAYDFKCTFDSAVANVTCAGTGATAGLTATAQVDKSGATCTSTDHICAWAGKRSDPFFFDFAAFQTLQATGDASVFVKPDGGPPGTNFFQGFNVLSIVLEVDVASAYTGADAGADAGTDINPPIVTVAAETRRTGN